MITNDTAKFPYMQIPANATFLGELYLGTSSIEGAGVLAELWTGITTNPNGTLNTHILVVGQYTCTSCSHLTALWSVLTCICYFCTHSPVDVQ